MLQVYDGEKFKFVRSEDYNFNFDKNTGFFARWGNTKEDDPQIAPAPEIADIEITDACEGIGDYGPCSFCYKANTPSGSYMPLNTFKKVFSKLPSTLTQIAFGVDAKCKSNPDTFAIMQHTRDNGIIPNVTVADVDEETAQKLANVCGSVAVSRYHDKEICYESIRRLQEAGQKQINIHIMVSDETEDLIYHTLTDYLNDDRLNDLNAIVLLSLKQKGRGKKYTPLSQEKFDRLVSFAIDHNIPMGFDSCSANKFLTSVKDSPDYQKYEQCVEPCESGCFSSYINTQGLFFPCSFVEGEGEWVVGLDAVNCDNFVNDIWNHTRTKRFRSKLMELDRNCPYFNI